MSGQLNAFTNYLEDLTNAIEENQLIITNPITGLPVTLNIPGIYRAVSGVSPSVPETVNRVNQLIESWLADEGDVNSIFDEDPTSFRDETPLPQTRPDTNPIVGPVVLNVSLYQDQYVTQTTPRPDSKKNIGKKSAKAITITDEDEDETDSGPVFSFEEEASNPLGCLISPPITATPYRQFSCDTQCLIDATAEANSNGFKQFLEWSVGQTVDFGIGEILNVGINAIALGTGVKGQAAKYLLLFGANALSSFIGSFTARRVVADSGVVSRVPTVFATPEDCNCVTPSAPTSDLEICNVCDDEDLNTCFIPIRNFKPNVPGNEGFKTQIQIVFSKNPKELFDDGVFSIPSPIDPSSLTKDIVLEAIYGSSTVSNSTPVQFGGVKYEVDVFPNGYLRYYGPIIDRPYDAVRSLFQRVSDLLIDGQILVDSNSPTGDTFRASDRQRRFPDQNLYPVKAIYLNFDTVPVSCIYIDLRSDENRS